MLNHVYVSMSKQIENKLVYYLTQRYLVEGEKHERDRDQGVQHQADLNR